MGSVLGGATVNLAAGHDLKVVGSSVVGDDNVNPAARNAISIDAATNQSRETHYVNVKESGVLSGGKDDAGRIDSGGRRQRGQRDPERKGESVSPYTGYWMSTQQARAITTMAPEQAGQLLGLPSAQAANILKNGMDVYAIMPKSGATPNVFVSNVARTTQGAVTMPGGAQQVIVPNRSLWTKPTPVNLVTLRPTGGK